MTPLDGAEAAAGSVGRAVARRRREEAWEAQAVVTCAAAALHCVQQLHEWSACWAYEPVVIQHAYPDDSSSVPKSVASFALYAGARRARIILVTCTLCIAAVFYHAAMQTLRHSEQLGRLRKACFTSPVECCLCFARSSGGIPACTAPVAAAGHIRSAFLGNHCFRASI